MNQSLRQIGFGFLGILLLSGCASTPQPPSANGGLFRQHNEGYSLLYKLMSDESDVGKIFILKHADDSVGNPIRDIAKVCQDAKKQMDEFPKSNNRIEYDVADLPYMEQQSRDLQAKDDTKALLGSSGKEFELRLIFTQAEATNYGMQLSKALAEKEDDPGRKAFLTNLAKQLSDLHDRMMSLLSVKA
jgi:hypothetical protein